MTASPWVRRATTGCLALMIVGGVVLRIQGIGWPAHYAHDEESFAANAHHYLLGLPDTNDHPPLGKLLIAVGLLLFGFDSVGWRFVPLCFGLQAILVAYWLGKASFSERRAGLYAAAFVAADGFFVAYSRAGLLDGILTCLVLWSMLAAVTARSLRGTLGAALLVGLAASVKWSGALAVVPAAAAVLVLGRAPPASIAAFALVPIVHLLVWMGALRLTGQAADPLSTWKVMVGLFHHHVELGHRTHVDASPWYTWLLLHHPIVIKHTLHGLRVRYASSVGNPVLFFPTTLAVVGLPLALGVGAVRARLRGLRLASLALPRVRAALLLALGWLALLATWMVGRGTYTFWYHYLPSYGFGLVLLAGGAAHLESRRPRLAAGFAALALGVAIYFAPVWGELPLDRESAKARLMFAPWRPR